MHGSDQGMKAFHREEAGEAELRRHKAVFFQSAEYWVRSPLVFGQSLGKTRSFLLWSRGEAVRDPIHSWGKRMEKQTGQEVSVNGEEGNPLRRQTEGLEK